MHIEGTILSLRHEHHLKTKKSNNMPAIIGSVSKAAPGRIVLKTSIGG